MPPRLAVLAIVVFWLATTTWLIYRDMVPEWQAAQGQPPKFTIEFMDEVGANYADWEILIGEEKDRARDEIIWKSAGPGRSEVRWQDDVRSYAFSTVLTFNKPRLLNRISKVESSYRVTEEKKLLSMNIMVRLLTGDQQDEQRRFDFTDFSLRAKVEDGFLKPTVRVGDFELMSLDPIRIPEQSGVLNPIQLGNKITGLHAGQTWSIPLLNPLSANPNLGAKSGAQLLAEVSDEADFPWENPLVASIRSGEVRVFGVSKQVKTVPCFRIDFRRSGETSPSATSWVRRSDGVVLQQKVSDFGVHLLLIRGN